MEPVNIWAARNNLSRLVAAASGGEDVVIAKRGVPIARLVAVDGSAPEHTAARVAEWLSTHFVPAHASRPAAQLDEQIATERGGWERSTGIPASRSMPSKTTGRGDRSCDSASPTPVTPRSRSSRS